MVAVCLIVYLVQFILMNPNTVLGKVFTLPRDLRIKAADNLHDLNLRFVPPPDQLPGIRAIRADQGKTG